jgi:hypothetical protein
MKKHLFVVEKTNTGYSAYAADFEVTPVGTTGKHMKELKKNVLDALNEYRSYKKLKSVTEKDVIISLDLHQFFGYYNEINAKAFAERIGMNYTLLSQYIAGAKKPGEKQVHKIIGGIKDLGKELTQLEIG